MSNPTPNRPPLWRMMEAAYHKRRGPGLSERHDYAAEIRAVRDHLFPGGRPDPVGVSLDCLAIWDELTAESERAERSDE